MHQDLESILIDEKRLQARVKELGEAISRDYEGRELFLVSVLKGSVVFMADLMRAINIPMSIDFLAVSSYGASTESSGSVKILKDLDKPIEGKHLLIAEDILDSGKTLRYIIDLMERRRPASLRLCTLLDKPERRKTPIHCQYTGFEVPDEFVVGYGLDYDEHYRNLPYIGILSPRIYNK